jgi:hypothetical protein
MGQSLDFGDQPDVERQTPHLDRETDGLRGFNALAWMIPAESSHRSLI